MSDYLEANRAAWDSRAPVHAASADYGFERFADDPNHLSDVVRFDRERLGDVAGLRGLHLQCHIGTDTVSLARLGARMTGLDLSPKSLEQARHLAEISGTGVDFVEAPVYAAVDALGREQFDLVYTGIGALCWLPSIAEWARTVSELLPSGGRLFLREGHPVLWALDDERSDDLLVLTRPYFERPHATVWEESATYVQTDVELPTMRFHEWNHGLGEIVTALLDEGMRLTMLVEHDSVPWEALPGKMEPTAFDEWRLRNHPERVPLTYTLQAVKN